MENSLENKFKMSVTTHMKEPKCKRKLMPKTKSKKKIRKFLMIVRFNRMCNNNNNNWINRNNNLNFTWSKPNKIKLPLKILKKTKILHNNSQWLKN